MGPDLMNGETLVLSLVLILALCALVALAIISLSFLGKMLSKIFRRAV